ncbi:MAG: hypothetical protein LQ342_005814 [Letrouitia transgressa]|nr:MAG: hypothetical protein LQ342_005814 [Letrouitia transgressa]
MASDEFYSLCLPILDNSEIDDEEKAQRIFQVIEGNCPHLNKTMAEQRTLEILHSHRDRLSAMAAPTQSRDQQNSQRSGASFPRSIGVNQQAESLEASLNQPSRQDHTSQRSSSLNPDAPLFTANSPVTPTAPINADSPQPFSPQQHSPSTQVPTAIPSSPTEAHSASKHEMVNQALTTLETEKTSKMRLLVSCTDEIKVLKKLIEDHWKILESNRDQGWSREEKDYYLERISRADYRKKDVEALKRQHQRRVEELTNRIEELHMLLPLVANHDIRGAPEGP